MRTIHAVMFGLLESLFVTSSYLSDSSEAGQRPQAAAVSDDHGLRQQTGRVVLGRIRLVVHCNEEQMNESSLYII